MNTYFTTDWHLDHRNILSFENRPFSSTDEMRECIINRTNERAKQNDRIVYGGDLMFGLDKLKKIYEVRKRINCEKIYLVVGNHDGGRFYATDGKLVEKGWAFKFKEQLLKDGIFKCVEERLLIKWTSPHVFISHYAHRTWPDQQHGTIHLYGHSHCNLPEDPNLMSMDICCIGNNYYPYSMSEILFHLGTRTFTPVDHHGRKE